MRAPDTDIYQEQAQLGQRLAMWSGFSLGMAAVMAWLGNRSTEDHETAQGRGFWQGVASQFAGWGLVDLIIALLGLKGAQKSAADTDAHTSEKQAKARADLRKILWVNTGLDVLYVGGGLALVQTKGKRDRFWRGAGWGIVAQGGFLLIFDLVHALLLGD